MLLTRESEKLVKLRIITYHLEGNLKKKGKKLGENSAKGKILDVSRVYNDQGTIHPWFPTSWIQRETASKRGGDRGGRERASVEIWRE